MRNLIQSNGDIHPCIAFDLEVVSHDKTDEYIDKYKEFKAPSNYKSDEAIRKYIEEAKYKERERAALHVPTQKIWVACVEDVLTGSRENFNSLDERDVIVGLFEYLNEFTDHVLVGFNSRGYDLPCLYGAALRLDITVPLQLRHPGLHADIIDDFYHCKVRLNDLAWLVGREKLMNGADVGQEYMSHVMNQDDDALHRVISYCSDDTNLVAEYIRRVYGVNIPF